MLMLTTKRLRLVGLGMIVVGLGIMLVAALADVVRLGALPDTFGIVQVIGLIVGFGGVANGLFFQVYEGHPEKPKALPTRDDLSRIEGIGPKMQTVLYGAGVQTYRRIANADPERLKAVIRSADIDAPLDPVSWPEQARLAAEERWDELAVLQERLIGGRDVAARRTGPAPADTDAEEGEPKAEEEAPEAAESSASDGEAAEADAEA